MTLSCFGKTSSDCMRLQFVKCLGRQLCQLKLGWIVHEAHIFLIDMISASMNKKYLCRLSQWEASEWKMRATLNLYDTLKKNIRTNSVFQTQLRVAEPKRKPSVQLPFKNSAPRLPEWKAEVQHSTRETVEKKTAIRKVSPLNKNQNPIKY